MRTLDDLFIDQLRDLLDAEKKILKALPKMAKAAKDHELMTGFKEHLAQTKLHVGRLETVFKHLGKPAKAKSCKGIEGIIKEGGEFLKGRMEPAVRDAGLIASAQRVEHYEMAGYGCAIAYARELGYTEAADLLEQTLNEEKETDKRLTDIAEGSVNSAAPTEETLEETPSRTRSREKAGVA